MPRPLGPSEQTLTARRRLLGAALAAPFGAPLGASFAGSFAGSFAVRPAHAQPRPRAAVPDDARAVARSQHFPFGPVVPPRSLAPWTVTTHRGQSAPLAALLQGRVTALQLMFTGCSATCPIQGALFAQALQQLGRTSAGAQFVSISIDALGDTPQALDAWLRRFGAPPGWWAAVPRVADVDALVGRLGDGGEPRPAGSDPHNGQVYLFDRRAELVLRTSSMPPAAQIANAIREVVARG